MTKKEARLCLEALDVIAELASLDGADPGDDGVKEYKYILRILRREEEKEGV